MMKGNPWHGGNIGYGWNEMFQVRMCISYCDQLFGGAFAGSSLG